MTAGRPGEPRLAALADELAVGGYLAAGWRRAFEVVPRHLFIPDRVWREDPEGYRVLRRGEGEERWWDLVYSDEAIVIQVEDGRDKDVSAYPSSSASMPRMVMSMLAALDVTDGNRVLEIGTGTGYNAALLSARLGDDSVTTIEVDKEITAHAKACLARAGFAPHVVTGDGADGCLPDAPYDRVIATCSVHRVPFSWVEQTRSGGIIVMPWGTAYHNGVLLRMEVGSGGSAVGRVIGDSSFMWLRAQRPPWRDAMSHVHHQEDAEASATTLDPRLVFGDLDADFALGIAVPECRYTVGYGTGDEADELTLWLYDTSGSWASVDFEPAATAYPVEQYGPRRLWDEVETAFRRWEKAGRPERERFGLTVTPERQFVWLDDPDTGRTWPVDSPHRW